KAEIEKYLDQQYQEFKNLLDNYTNQPNILSAEKLNNFRAPFNKYIEFFSSSTAENEQALVNQAIKALEKIKQLQENPQQAQLENELQKRIYEQIINE